MFWVCLFLFVCFLIKESSCPTEDIINTTRCLPVYDEQNEENQMYNLPGWTPIKNLTKLHSILKLETICPKPWRYQTARHLESLPFRGLFFDYGGGGFAADLGYNCESAHGVIKNLEKNNWIDDRSAAVFVEFTIFEPSSNLFSAVKYLFERGPTGGVNTKRRIDTLVLYYPTDPQFRSFYQVCQLLFMFVICCFFVFELVELYRRGWKYFRGIWNWAEMLQIMSAVSAEVIFFFKARYASNFVKKIQENPYQTSSSDSIVWWSYIELFLLSFVVFIVTVKLLRLLKFNSHICHLMWTLKTSCKHLMSFFAVFMAILMAYVQLGTLLFGRSVYNYSSVSQSLRILVERLLGKNRYTNELMDQEYRIVGPLFVFTYSVTIIIVMLNMFLSILNSSYLHVRKTHKRKFAEVELAKFAWDYFISQIKRHRENLATFIKDMRRKRELVTYHAKGSYNEIPMEDFEGILEFFRASETEYPNTEFLVESISENDLEMATLDETDDIWYADEGLREIKFSLKDIEFDLKCAASSWKMTELDIFSSSDESCGEGSYSSLFGNPHFEKDNEVPIGRCSCLNSAPG